MFYIQILPPNKSYSYKSHNNNRSFLLFLFLFTLHLPQTISLLYTSYRLTSTLLHQLPTLTTHTVRLNYCLLPLTLFLNLLKMTLEVIQLIRYPLELFLSITFCVCKSEHLLIVVIDQIYQLSLISRFLIFVLAL